MRIHTVTGLILFATLLVVGPARAIERSNADEAIALIDKALDYMKKNGKEKSIAEFNNLNSPFNVTSEINKKGDLYLFMFDASKPGTGQVVHGKNPKIVGKDVSDMRDADGVYLIREIIKACNSPAGKGWVSYKWPNPVSKAVESKQSYVVRIDEYCLGTGIYK
ncbi:cache domain-containing protein [Rugamonas sp. CCM 8940]|uniref:cache domain-containing protein n=1 Tax=Rugamonas sp. CCM 8940 TaxID=2765359 RepID=UPI0018F3FA30|nr:cache domain-containing protein [Rugamonas sp. CCM 8940]MBJ7313806.1 cache domain-containing protein [Rugamonas sp. CCM 8940]